jgi:hypothetical protein
MSQEPYTTKKKVRALYETILSPNQEEELVESNMHNIFLLAATDAFVIVDALFASM